MASVNRDEEQRWVPTHVQVLVIRARGLRAKGKHGTSDAYTVMQLGKEKYSTRLMEKTTEPEWGEECSFELQPGVLDDTGPDGHPAGTCDLTLTVMHRALIGLDVFLGQTVISLDKAFRERVCIRNEWYKLHSKTGKKEKERGELQLTVQFTRHNLTASMYDLSMKDKPRSAFIRLRERMRARKRGVEEESSSAIVPGGYGASSRPRGRLPSDGGGEEDYEDDEGGELRRSKMRSYFLHGRLRKSSDTRSSTSLGSESSESSSRGGSLSPTAGISVVVSDLSNSPSNSSNLTADNSPDHTVSPSPLVSPVRQMFDEVSDDSIPVPHSLYTDSDAPILLPSVCVNGNPVETSPLTHHPPSLVLQQTGPQIEFQQDSPKTSRASPPEKGKPTQAQTTQPSKIKPQPGPALQPKQPEVESKSKPDPQFYAVGLLQKSSALSLSLQNLSRPKEELQGGGPVEGRRWSFDKPGEEEKAAISAALEHAGLIADEAVVETDVSVSKLEVEGKKKRGLFSHSRAEKEETGQAQSATEGRHRGWFSSKEPYDKPSPAIDQPEVPASIPRNPMLPMHVAEPGNAKGNLADGSLQDITNSFSRTDASDDSNTHTLWHNFIGDCVKLKSMTGPQNMTITTYSYLAEPTKQNPTCCKGDLNRSKAQENLCNLIVDSLPLFKAEANFMHCSTHKNGLNNFVPVDTLEYSEFDYSLLHKSNINFSELNTVACPYPTCLDKDKVSIVSVCKTNVIPGAIFGSSGSPDPLAINSESFDSLDQGGNSEPKTSICIASKRQTDDRTKGSVEIQTLSLPYCNYGILGASSIETSKSRSMSCNVLESKSILKDWKNFKSDDCIGVGVVELQGSAIHERTHLNVHPETYPLESSIPFGPGDSALQGKLKMEKDATSNQDCGASFVGIRFDLKNFKDITDSIDLCKVSFTKQKVTDSPPCTSKESFRIGCITETVSGLCEVDAPNGRRPTLSLAVSQQHAVSHSLYESVDSEQYLTCMSQNISTLPNSDSPQEGFPIDDQSPKSLSVLQDPADIFQDAWRKTGAISQDALPNPPVSLSFLPKVVCSQNTVEKCDLTKEVIKDTNTNESQQNDDLPKDTPMNLMFEMITRRAAEERLKVEPHTFNSDDLCSTELPQSRPVQNDAPPPPVDLEMITGFCQSTENTRISDFVLEPTTCITQDLVTTDLLLENVFVAQRAVTHSVCTSPVTHLVPGESCAKMELCPEFIKELQMSKNKRMPTTAASVPQGEHLEGSSHLNNKQLSLSEPSTMDHLNSGHLFLNPASPFLDLLPLASSTPHIAVGINTMAQFPFPMPSASAKTLLHTTLATAALSPVFTPSNNHFPQEEHQVACHLSSPHPVKPLTPPDEKRSEGRSVLDKIKSTINPGRGHQGDLEYEKKLLVEGGGSYYHLNHSELVSLLLQREAELQQERKEYEHRGLLLQKREMEIKKMKFLIRDLEDYIDTLLVRIMEQTPALLQVRSKMK